MFQTLGVRVWIYLIQFSLEKLVFSNNCSDLLVISVLDHLGVCHLSLCHLDHLVR